MEKTWRDAIVRVLSEADSPLHYTEVSEQIFARGYYQTDGATPAATVNAQISASIKHDGDKSLQDVDPELKEREIQATLRAIDQKLRGGG